MKKLLLLYFVIFATFTPLLQSISLKEYIQQNGMPHIAYDSLNLSDKKLTDLTGLQDIPGIRQAKSIHLDKNELETLPTDIFNNLHDLSFLSLNNNKLKNLPADIFKNLTNLEFLSLNNNQLENLTPSHFSWSL